jgi:hypothetical protein
VLTDKQSKIVEQKLAFFQGLCNKYASQQDRHQNFKPVPIESFISYQVTKSIPRHPEVDFHIDAWF